MQKVIAYVTHGDELLVFEQSDFPEAGTQVPGGALENQELPAVGVMRGAAEETGLRICAPCARWERSQTRRRRGSKCCGTLSCRVGVQRALCRAVRRKARFPTNLLCHGFVRLARGVLSASRHGEAREP
jgi:hypothetical protein